MSAHPARKTQTFDLSMLTADKLAALRLLTRSRLLIHQNRGGLSLTAEILSDLMAAIDIELTSRGDTTHG